MKRCHCHLNWKPGLKPAAHLLQGNDYDEKALLKFEDLVIHVEESAATLEWDDDAIAEHLPVLLTV